ncbi:purine-nucleoside phosphorylase [Treponema sp. R6D11]
MQYIDKIKKAAKYINKKVGVVPDVLVALGSGLEAFANLEGAIRINFADIPFFPVATAPGHKGELVFTEYGGINIAIMNGRVHAYEGYTPKEVAFPIAVFGYMGTKGYVSTNASGGINEKYDAGDIMLFKDHINIDGSNPLIGEVIPELSQERFPDMAIYNKNVRERILKRINLHEGVYSYRYGPCFETPAEVIMLRAMGADAVAMSSVHENIMAKNIGMNIAALTLIANKAVTEDKPPITHEEVLIAGATSKTKMIEAIKIAIEEVYAEL